MVEIQFPTHLPTNLYIHPHPFLAPGLQLEVCFLFVASFPTAIMSFTLTSPGGIGGPLPFSYSLFTLSCTQPSTCSKMLSLPPPPTHSPRSHLNVLLSSTWLSPSSPSTHNANTETPSPDNPHMERPARAPPGDQDTAFYFPALRRRTGLTFHLTLLRFHRPLQP